MQPSIRAKCVDIHIVRIDERAINARFTFHVPQMVYIRALGIYVLCLCIACLAKFDWYIFVYVCSNVFSIRYNYFLLAYIKFLLNFTHLID